MSPSVTLALHGSEALDAPPPGHNRWRGRLGKSLERALQRQPDVADGLHPRSARCDGCPKWAFKTVAYGDMTRCHIGQERWRREGRQLARATCVSGAHRLCDGAEASDA